MPMDSSWSIDASTPRASRRSRTSRSARKYGRAASGSSTAGGMIMRPTTRLDRAPRGVENRRQFVFAGAVLGGFPGDVDLDEQIDRSSRGVRRLVDLLHQRRAV